MIKSKSDLIEKLLSEYVETDASIKIPNILIVLWVTYGHRFHMEYPVHTVVGIEKFTYWWLTHIKHFNHYGKALAREKIFSVNHVIIKDIYGCATTNPTVLMELIWNNRPDLISQFPDILDVDSRAYWEWWISIGAKECECSHIIPLLNLDKDIDFLINIIWRSRQDLHASIIDPYFNGSEKIKSWWVEFGQFEYIDNAPVSSPVILKERIVKSRTNKIAVIGHPTGVFGLGEDARLINECLINSGYEIDLYSADSGINASKMVNSPVLNIDDYEDIYLCNIFVLPAFDMLKIMLDEGLRVFTSTVNIAIWQWELSGFPKEANFAFELVNTVCSISSFTADSLSKRTNKYVPVIPLPVKDVTAVVKSRSELNLPDNNFLFFFSFDAHSFISRKNPVGVIEAFQRAFRNDEKVSLILKVMNESISDLWNECKRRAHVDKRIIIVDQVMSRDQYLSLLYSIDAVISLHRSEGFGRIIAEALLMEKPVIVSNYSGNTDYTKEENSELVNGDLVPVYENDYVFYNDNVWFEPNLDDAAERLRDVYENYDKAVKKAEIGRRYILDNYSLDATKTKILNVFLITVVNESGLFDKDFYCAECQISDIDPAEHFLINCCKSGCNPSDKFNTNFYLDMYPDVKDSGMNPLVHYVLYGKSEGRLPCVLNVIENINDLNDDVVRDLQPIKNGYIFISHETSQTGAPICLLNICKKFKEKYSYPLVIVLMSGGALEDEFKNIAPVINLNITIFNKQTFISNENERVFRALSSLGYRRCIANTVISGLLTGFLQRSFIETTYLVHEMPDLIREYKFIGAALNIAKSRSPVVFAADYVKNTFIDNYGLSNDVSYISEQPVIDNVVRPDRKSSRLKLINKLCLKDSNIKIILSAGLTQYRKGTDLFLAVAEMIYSRGLIENYHFIWLGNRDKYYEKWNNEARLDLAYSDHIHFLDFEKDPAYIFAASDVFLLTSREDPLPGVALLSLNNSVPVIMFEGTGGIQDIIDSSNGLVVPQFDVGRMADYVLQSDRIFHASIQPRKVSSFDDYTNNLLAIFEADKANYNVSVIIPNYNYSQYIVERISSISNQTHRPAEIIFLDDASSDDSVDIAEMYLKSLDIPYKIIVNSENKGVFKQWERGIAEASFEYIWVAEADDVADEYFLQTLLTAFKDDAVSIAYCQSRIIDKDGVVVQDDLLSHTDDLDKNKWRYSYKSSGLREVVDSLWYRNTIPNASACIFQKSHFSRCSEIFKKFKYCGDWALYVALLKHGKISFYSQSLNSFRRHDNAVTKSKGKDISYLKEILEIKLYMAMYFPIHRSTVNKMFNYVDMDYQIDEVEVNSDLKLSHEIRNEIILETRDCKRLMFITTNDGSPTGGSEVLWIEAALEMLKNRHTDVAVVTKKWNPVPEHIEKFIDVGVKVYFKEVEKYAAVTDFQPDLVVFSLGDQDEGSDWFEVCRNLSIPYVIVNQLTKEEEFLSADKILISKVKENYTKAKKVFFTCENNKKLLEKRIGAALNNAQLHFNPYHMDRSVSIAYPQNEDNYCLAVPGRLINIHKGQDIVVEIMKCDKWRRRNIVINFYGNGPDRDDLEAKVRKYNIKNIIFNDHKDNVLDIWRENHAILLSSRMEGVPIVLIGAMMCERVPIVTDVGGHSEIIQNDKDGFIASSPTVLSLDEALERAWECRFTWEDIGKESRKSILEFMPEDPLRDFIKKLTVVIDECKLN